MSAAMLPPAPGLFSTTTDWPQTSCRRLQTRRAVMSVEPPGVNGTTTRTGLTGQSAPAAREARSAALQSRQRQDRQNDGDSAWAPPGCDRPIVSGRRFAEVWGGRRQNQCDVQVTSPRLRGEVRISRSLRVFVVILGGGNAIGIRQPAVQIDIAAALGTERLRGLGGRLAADRARLCGSLAGPGIFWRLSWHSTSRSGSENLRRRAA